VPDAFSALGARWGMGRAGRAGTGNGWRHGKMMFFFWWLGGGHIGKNLVRWFFVFFDGDYGFYDDVIYLLAIFTKFLGDTC